MRDASKRGAGQVHGRVCGYVRLCSDECRPQACAHTYVGRCQPTAGGPAEWPSRRLGGALVPPTAGRVQNGAIVTVGSQRGVLKLCFSCEGRSRLPIRYVLLLTLRSAQFKVMAAFILRKLGKGILRRARPAARPCSRASGPGAACSLILPTRTSYACLSLRQGCTVPEVYRARCDEHSLWLGPQASGARLGPRHSACTCRTARGTRPSRCVPFFHP